MTAPLKKEGSRARGKTLATVAAGLAWLAAVSVGMWLLARYANSPAQESRPPAHWPAASGMRPDGIRPTLVMFVHPRCPCSEASLEELSRLLARCQGRVNAHVQFIQPKEMAPNWYQTPSWREAGKIPGVAEYRDDDGREAKLFRAKTSGDTALYDAKGNLLFHGGITVARGHAGDNVGLDAVEDMILGKPSLATTAPTFGCSLFDCETESQ
jgi:hypothetical protein